MRVLVIGAAGLVGREVVTAIQRSGAGDVIAGLRRPNKSIEEAGVETRVFDACDADALGSAMAGVTHVVDCVMGSAQTMLASARNILTAAERRPGLRVVQMSSLAVFGDTEGRISETAQPSGDVDWYGRAKRLGEAHALEAAGKGVEVVILRPGLVYGPGSRLWTERIARLLTAGRLGDLGAAGEGLCNLIYRDDVAQAVLASLTVEVPGLQAFNLSQPDPPSWNSYLCDFARALGVDPVKRISSAQLSIERYGLAAPLKLLEMARDKLGPKVTFVTPDPLTPGLTRLFARRTWFDCERVARSLNMRWTHYSEGVAVSAAWCKRHSMPRQAR